MAHLSLGLSKCHILEITCGGSFDVVLLHHKLDSYQYLYSRLI